MSLVIGVDLGGTKTAAGLVAADGTVIRRVSAPTPAAKGPAAVLQTIVDLATRLTESAAGAPLAGCGIGAAGVIDPVSRTVQFATNSLPGWTGTRLGAEIEDRLGLPVATVNDVHAHALGEAVHGAGRGERTVLVLAAGTGIGGALVIDGVLQSGRHGAAGHYGHLPAAEAAGLACTCGGTGHLEVIASGPAILDAYLRHGGSPVRNTQEIFARADAGDTLAAEIIDVAASALGRALGGLINSVDPDIVIVGGGLAAAGPRWWTVMESHARAEALGLLAGCHIVPTRLGADSAIVGAASLLAAPAVARLSS
ncbi:ROK family protein [Cryobacterium sp. SO2]|uniref:ROK family protein n=1 Tax=Cryobacterium sp. SO2 TaxID=1897060 RepID=UPI00223D20DA|nr:ROK family protein [Cryobacterium sp. SO2]WEO75977.1 ROK family protein [Cryobacterium sp. SO2]